MTNLRELFTEYHAGFQDFVPWLDHHIEMHRRHPLECAEFGAEWLRRWEVVGRLLCSEARIYTQTELWAERWLQVSFEVQASKAIVDCVREHSQTKRAFRIVLLNGTIIREWGPK